VKRRKFIVLLCSVSVGVSLPARAQQSSRPVVGFLSISSPGPHAPFVAAFNQGLREVGFNEGQNVAIEYRWAEGQFDRLPTLAADLASRKVDVIAAVSGDVSIRAASGASLTIPVVFITGSDPVQNGTVASLARPGGNLTGFSMISTELTAKRLFVSSHREQIVGLASRYVVPAIYEWKEFAAAGGLISYGTSLTDVYRDVGVYVGKILKGAKPAEIPVEQPTKFELVINLKTAKTMGITVPPSLLARADEVIE
jgi:ABC-type uncharacterized transport system substrate-binding protein